MSAGKMKRRGFLKGAAGAAAGMVAAPYVITSSALGAGGRAPASERIVMGGIGLGGMGTGDLGGFLGFSEVQVVAVCDVDTNHRNRAVGIVNGRYGNKDCAGYNDFRRLLARDDLDAVFIALPDHWHAIPAIMAARRGLDIHAQKPLARTIVEGRAICDAVKRYGIVWQTGSQQRSDGRFRFACELVRNGRIGKVHTVKVGLPGGHSCGPQPVMPVPDGFDYDMWLGPAPWSPYTKNRCHWNFRWIWDYSGGQITDWAGHHCDIAQWGMGTEHTGPVEIEGKGEWPKDGLWNTVTRHTFTCTYKQGFKMIVSSQNRMGARWEGTDGWVWVDRGGIDAEPKSLLNERIGPNEIHLYESRGHHRNFIECVKTRAETVAPAEVAQRSISIGHLGNIAMKLGRKVHWNPDRERFINDPEADRWLDRPKREPWRL